MVLLSRTTRSVSLTDAGKRLLERHFGKGSVVVGAPPSARKLPALRKHMNGLPGGVEDLLASADGIAVEGVVHRIMSSARPCSRNES